MLRTVAIPVALGAVLAATGAIVFAQTTQPPVPGAAPTQTSLAQAIRVAEEETRGRARKAEIERERGVDAYEIKTVAKDESAKVLVDPLSGKVLKVSRPGFFGAIGNLFDDDRREDQAALARLEASPMTLAGAIAAAERETGGRAVKAALKSKDGQTLFEVGVVRDSARQKVMVDPATGKVVALAKRKDGHD